MAGPQTKLSQTIHAEKYRSAGESFDEAMSRIACHLKDSDEHYHTFRQLLLTQKFLPGGRVQASAGAAKAVSPINCFMSGDIEDSFVTGSASIMARASEAAATMRLGGGIGTNFSTLRPAGDRIKGLDSSSSGAVSFMEIFNAVGSCVSSSGHRRGAQMGVLRIDHPDVEKFIHAKNDSTSLTAFNMSILVTDKFMEAVKTDSDFDLVFDGRVYETIKARPLWEKIMRSTYDYAEPGIIFIDKIQRENNLQYCETITGTNPCGEIPLPPFGACLLGSFNLTKYVRDDFSGVDLVALARDAAPCLRALDNVIDRASVWPLAEQEREMKAKRRIGIGFTGLANALEACGLPYGSPMFLDATAEICRTLRDALYEASVELAVEKGPFPMFEEKLLYSDYARRLPVALRAKVAAHGLRNSHLLALAPTGTISLTADNVSSSLEPVFAHEYDRTVIMPEGPEVTTVQDYAVRSWDVRGKTANDLTPDEHLAVLSTCSPYFDQSISKTINVPTDISWDNFKGVYMKAWSTGCKGVTTFRIGGKRFAIMNEKKEETASSCEIDSSTGRMECS